MKQCSKCKETKPYSEFYKHKTNLDGHFGSCISCYLAHSRKKYAENIEFQRNRSRKKAAKEFEQFPEKVRERRRKSMAKQRQLNPDKFRQRDNLWKKNHPEITNANSRRRRAKAKNNGVYKINEKFLKRLYSSSCVACGSTSKITADHIIPIARGGRHSEGNLQPLCLSCNSAKKDKLWIEWKP